MSLSDRFRAINDEKRAAADRAAAQDNPGSRHNVTTYNEPSYSPPNQQMYSFQERQQSSSSIEVQLEQLAQLKALNIARYQQAPQPIQFQQPQYQQFQPPVYQQPIYRYSQPQRVPYQQPNVQIDQQYTPEKRFPSPLKAAKQTVFLNPKAIKKLSTPPATAKPGAKETTKPKKTLQERLGRSVSDRLDKPSSDQKDSRERSRPLTIQERLGGSSTDRKRQSPQSQKPTIQDRLGKTIQDRLGKTLEERIGRTLDERLGRSAAKPYAKPILKKQMPKSPVKVKKVELSLDTLNIDIDKFMWKDEKVAGGKLDDDISEYMRELADVGFL